jgi:flagellar biosynthesis chaperone FliJ
LDAINDDFFALQCELTEVEEKLQKQQQIVLESMRARKVLDQLRDKQMTLYQHEVAREELQIMEEAVNPRISREAMERARNQTEI